MDTGGAAEPEEEREEWRRSAAAAGEESRIEKSSIKRNAYLMEVIFKYAPDR